MWLLRGDKVLRILSQNNQYSEQSQSFRRVIEAAAESRGREVFLDSVNLEVHVSFRSACSPTTKSLIGYD